MAEQILRNRQGLAIGKIKNSGKGILEIHDKTGRLLGKYDEKTNTTRDRTGKVIGKGNFLTSLLSDFD